MEVTRRTDLSILSWRANHLPSWFAVAEKVQTVKPVPGNAQACEVKQWETMSGWGAYVYNWIWGWEGELGRMGVQYLEDLKKRAHRNP